MILDYEDVEQARDQWDKATQESIEAQMAYEQLDARKRDFKDELFIKMEGSTIREKEALTATSDEWRAFLKGLLKAREIYLKKRHIAEDLDKQWLMKYTQWKMQTSDKLKSFGGM